MSEWLANLLLPGLSRRRPESAGLEGWLAQIAMAAGTAHRRADARAGSALAGMDLTGDPLQALMKNDEYPVDVSLGPELAFLLGDGLVAMHEGPDRETLVGALMHEAAMTGGVLHIAAADDDEANAWAERIGPWAEDARLSWSSDASSLVSRTPPRICIASTEALAVSWLRRIRAELHEPARRRLLLLAAERSLLDYGRRQVQLYEDVRRPHLHARTVEADRLALQLETGTDFTTDELRVTLTDAGRARLADLAAQVGDWWQGPRRREATVRLAASARFALQRDRHFRDSDDGPVLVPEALPEGMTTEVHGVRLAQLLRLHAGLGPAPQRVAVAGAELQRFVRSHPHVAGFTLPGTDSKSEFRRLYGLPVRGEVSLSSVRLAAAIADDEAAALKSIPQGACWVRTGERDEIPGRCARQAVEIEAPDRAAGGIFLVGGPKHPRERRQLRAALSAELGGEVLDLLWREHPLVEMAVQDAGDRMARRFLAAGIAVQSLWLRRALATAESLEVESRIAMYRTMEIGRDRYAFLGGAA